MGSDDNTFSSLSKKYKCMTADKAQVCDGRNWEAVRDTLELESTTSSADSMDDQDEKRLNNNNKGSTDGIANMLRYRPTSKKSLLPNEAEIPIVSSEEKRRDSKSSQSSFIPHASFNSDSETSMLDLSQHSGNSANEAQQSEKHIASRRYSADDSTEDKSRGAGDLAFRPNASHSTRRSAAGREGDDGTSGRTNRRSTIGDISTSSGTNNRRSSNGDISTSSRTNRRNTVGEDGANTSRSKPILRKLSKPKHRCVETNQSVLGIMRPARYSSNNLASLNSTNDLSGMSRRHSVNNLSAMGVHQSLEMPISTSYSGLPRGGSNASFDVNNMKNGTNSMANASWVAHGVQFSKSMEVYVFKK